MSEETAAGPNHLIFRAEATGADIQKVLEAVQPVIADFPRTHVMMACLALALMVQDPELSIEELHDGVVGMSQWACLYLHRLEESKTQPGTVDASQVN